MIKIIVGSGTMPIYADYQKGDTVASVLQRAKIELRHEEIPIVLGMAIHDPAGTPMEDNTRIVIGGKPGNGTT